MRRNSILDHLHQKELKKAVAQGRGCGISISQEAESEPPRNKMSNVEILSVLRERRNNGHVCIKGGWATQELKAYEGLGSKSPLERNHFSYKEMWLLRSHFLVSGDYSPTSATMDDSNPESLLRSLKQCGTNTFDRDCGINASTLLWCCKIWGHTLEKNEAWGEESIFQ